MASVRRERFLSYIPVDMPSTIPGSVTAPTHVSVEVDYRKGGTNLFSGNAEPRGYELTLNPVTMMNGGGIGFTIGDTRGTRIFLKPAARFNAKELAALAAKVLPLAESLAAAIAAGDKTAAATLARGALAEAA